MTIRIFTIVALLFASLQGFSQLTVDNELTVEEYITDVLLGSGVTVSNITFNGGTAAVQNPQVGSFNSELANVGINSGLIVTTGDVIGAVGPNNGGGYTGANDGNTGAADPDLVSIMSPDNPTNWAIIEFDFVPNGDTIRFNYVFGSEEYPEYVDSFNDGFGFFLSGPGINGPYTNDAENIALIPGTDIPVTINNVNNGNDGINGPCDYCEFYIHNGSGGDPEWDPDNAEFWDDETLIQYDGFTTPLEALAVVQCGETYHIKIAISDANDSALDSAVFLQEGSFSSPAAVVANLDIDGLTAGGDPLMYESCGSANLLFSRGAATTQDEVFITVTGTAESGVDYTAIPPSIIFLEGVFEVSIPISAFEDFIVEGAESVTLEMENVAQCSSQPIETSFTFFIEEPTDMVTEPVELIACVGAPTELEPNISGGTGLFISNWNNGMSGSPITVFPTVTDTYFVTVTDSCTGEMIDAEVLVNVIPNTLDGQIVNNDFVIGCFDDVLIESEYSGEYESIDITWTDENGVVLSTDENFTYSNGGGGAINLTLVDGCGSVITDQILASPANPLIIDAGVDVIANCDDQVPFAVDIAGGEGPFDVVWEILGTEVANTASADIPAQEALVHVLVTDQCGVTEIDSLNMSIQEYPIQVVLPPDFVICFGELAEINGSASGGYNELFYEWNNNMGNNPSIVVDPDQQTTYQLTVTDVCGNEGFDNITVDIFSMESDFNHFFQEENVAQFVPYTDPDCPTCDFSWDFGDGNSSEENSPVHTFDGFEVYTTTMYLVTQEGCVDSVKHDIQPSPFVFIPTAFTPNNDGVNDVFRVVGTGLFDYELEIFNRWGEVVFKSSDIDDVWTGGADAESEHYVHPGAYSYRITYRGFNSEVQSLTGQITVIR